MLLLAIDPGNEQSAYLEYDTETGMPVRWAKVTNEILRRELSHSTADAMAIEMVASYGMSVGETVFSTCVWAGRFIERWWFGYPNRTAPLRVYRKDCKMHLCGSMRAKDANIRQALIDRYGPGKEKAIGLKASPGVLYGMKADCWAALAVAVTAADTRLGETGSVAA